MRYARAILLVALIVNGTAGHAQAREANYTQLQDWLWFAAGAAAGLMLHESGHLAFDLVTGDKPRLKAVRLGPFPFFAIAPQIVKSRTQLYGASMMGFVAEAIYTEMIFASYPVLSHRHRPMAEGMLAFHCALDLGYAITGIAEVGPRESDVNSMARASTLSPRTIGILVALPIVFDVLRYLKPEWLRDKFWVSAAARVLMFHGALTW